MGMGKRLIFFCSIIRLYFKYINTITQKLFYLEKTNFKQVLMTNTAILEKPQKY